MTRTILRNQGHGFLVEGWTTDHRFGGCRLHVSKSYEEVDGEFFLRVGLQVPPTSSCADSRRCIFSEDELAELGTPLASRLRAAINARDLDRARELVSLTQSSWEAGLLPAYRHWITELYASLRDRFGNDAFLAVFYESAYDFFVPAWMAADTTLTQSVWKSFWRCLSGLCSPTKFTTATSFEVLPAAIFGQSERAEPIRAAVPTLCASFNDSAGSRPSGPVVVKVDGNRAVVKIGVGA